MGTERSLADRAPLERDGGVLIETLIQRRAPNR